MKKSISVILLLILSVCISYSAPQSVVTILDVGQADSILIQSNGKNVLIDAGNDEDSDVIIDFLKTKKVTSLDALILTHPHEDHIGGADEVIEAMKISKIYMPDVMAETRTFENVLMAVDAKNMTITTPKVGAYIFNDKISNLQILSPKSANYDETNDYSIVTKLTVGKRSILFTGDAEVTSEKEMLAGKTNLKSDVLKVGHHGGRTSSSSAFLKKVAPEYAIISVGLDNSYGHPHKETITRLKGMKILRTDENGTVTITTDGSTLKVSSARGSIAKSDQPKSTQFFVTKSGEKYHLDGCKGLSKSKIPITAEDIKKKGYEPCSLCNPPAIK